MGRIFGSNGCGLALVEALERRAYLSAGFSPRASADAGAVVARPDYNTGTGFYIVGDKAYDAHGYEFTIRGFNHTTRQGDNAKNLESIGEFAKTGANAVRAVLGTFGAGVSPSQRRDIVERYLDAGIVPVVEDHSVTNGTTLGPLQAIVDRWLLPDNLAWLKQYERDIILNITNEWGPNTTIWRDAYISSIARLRAAGVNAMIMIDAAGSGQNIHSIHTWAKDILDADPQHNVMFSIHMYGFWRTEEATDVGTWDESIGSPWDIATELAKVKAAGLPIIVGEFSSDAAASVWYDTLRAMQSYDSLGLGWMAWSWNQNNTAALDIAATTATWQYDSDADLSNFGKLVVTDPVLGLKAHARPSTAMHPARIFGVLTDAGGAPVEGATVFIDDNDNQQRDPAERSVVTSGDGAYAFEGLPQGTHRLIAPGASDVTVQLPAGESVQADLSPATGTSIRGYVWDDTSRDGFRNNGEALRAGESVFLDLDSNGSVNPGEPVAITDAQGRYQFDGVTPGTYRLRVVLPPEHDLTTLPLDITDAAGRQLVAAPIGLMLPPALGSISGVLFQDLDLSGTRETSEPGHSIREVFLDLNVNGNYDADEPRINSAGDGAFLFTRLTPGDYTVARSTSGWQVTTPPVRVTVHARQVTSGVMLGGIESPASVSGIVYSDSDSDGTRDAGEPVSVGRTVYIDLDGNGSAGSTEPQTQTNASGAFSFTGLRPTGYVLRAVPPSGQVLTTGGVSVNLNPGQATTGVAIGVGVSPTPPPPTNSSAISGVVFHDANANRRLDVTETRVGGMQVYLDQNGNGALDAVEPVFTTDASGAYNFTNLAAASHKLRMVLPTGVALTTPVIDVILSPAQNFSIARFGLNTLPPDPGDTITLQSELATHAGGTGKSTSWTGYTGTGYADYAGEGSSATYAITRPTATAASLAFRYANGSGGDRPVQVFVNDVLVGTLNFAKTGGWTNWAVATLASVNLPAGSSSIRAVASTSSGGPNVDQLVITPAPVVPPPPTGSIGGRVFDDANTSGTFDAGETLLVGQIVFLDQNQNNSLDTGEISTSTAVDGSYQFTGLVAGAYSVRRVLPSDHVYTTSLINLTLTGGQIVLNADIGSTLDLTPPPPTPTTYTLQGEAGSFAGGTAKGSSHTGYTGTGYADYAGQNSAVTYTPISDVVAGAYSLQFRYANGSTANRPQQIFVNNVLVGTLNFAKTGGWTTWATTSLTAQLPAGTVTIKAVASTSAGGANVDQLVVSPTTVVPPPPPPPPPVTTGSIGGFLFWDANKNGAFDTGDTYQAGKVVFIDVDGDNVLDSTEKKLTTDANGKFTFTGLAAGTYKVRRVVPNGYKVTTAPANITITSGQIFSTVAIGTASV